MPAINNAPIPRRKNPGRWLREGVEYLRVMAARLSELFGIGHEYFQKRMPECGKPDTVIRSKTAAKPMNQSEPPARALYPHFLEIPTRWMDNDTYGHVN